MCGHTIGSSQRADRDVHQRMYIYLPVKQCTMFIHADASKSICAGGGMLQSLVWSGLRCQRCKVRIFH